MKLTEGEAGFSAQELTDKMTLFGRMNYCHIEPNSQYFDSLDQIQEYLRLTSDDEYLKKAIKNTIEKGYELMKTK